MIKKIYIFIFLGILIISCGKKGDPIFNENQKNQSSKIISTQLSTFS